MRVNIRCRNATLPAAERTSIDQCAEFALSQYRERVRQVAVILHDENGERGGVDKTCRATARVAPLGDVVAEGKGETFDAAARVALDRVARMIARGLGRLSGRRKGRTSMAGEGMDESAALPKH